MPYDSGGLEILDIDECLALLSLACLGRIVFTERALPAIQPVGYVMSGRDVIIRTSAGSRLAAAARRAIVAFEIDDFDADKRSGWSVVLVGPAQVVSDEAELRRLEDLPLPPWVEGRDHFIRVTPEIITGRRISTPADAGQ